jgi:hypothetical protein
MFDNSVDHSIARAVVSDYDAAPGVAFGDKPILDMLASS